VALSRKRGGGNALPAPPTSADTNLNGYEFMPILVARLFGSEFHNKANPIEWRAGVTLWLKSWHQVPAGSLPDDDEVLFRLAELGKWCSYRQWMQLRSMVLHNWVKCSDGRLYHPVISQEVEKALLLRENHLLKLQANAERNRRWRAVKKARDASCDASVMRHETVTSASRDVLDKTDKTFMERSHTVVSQGSSLSSHHHRAQAREPVGKISNTRARGRETAKTAPNGDDDKDKSKSKPPRYPARWWRSEKLTQQVAASLDIKPKIGEKWEDLCTRLFEEINRRKKESP
jgi:uncharacterized protein DUF1376